MAFQAVTEGPYSVDTFFFIGATLVSYLLLKVMSIMVNATMWLPSQPGPWQDKWLAQPEGFCPHGVFLYEQVLGQNSPADLHLHDLTLDLPNNLRYDILHCTDCSALASLMACSSSSWLGCLRPNSLLLQPKIMTKWKITIKILTGASSDHHLTTICSPVCSGRSSTMR